MHGVVYYETTVKLHDVKFVVRFLLRNSFFFLFWCYFIVHTRYLCLLFFILTHSLLCKWLLALHFSSSLITTQQDPFAPSKNCKNCIKWLFGVFLLQYFTCNVKIYTQQKLYYTAALVTFLDDNLLYSVCVVCRWCTWTPFFIGCTNFSGDSCFWILNT